MTREIPIAQTTVDSENHCDVAVGYSVWNIVCKESA